MTDDLAGEARGVELALDDVESAQAVNESLRHHERRDSDGKAQKR